MVSGVALRLALGGRGDVRVMMLGFAMGVVLAQQAGQTRKSQDRVMLQMMKGSMQTTQQQVPEKSSSIARSQLV
jgi:hypothetical protein